MISISTIIRLRTAAEGASPINIHRLDKKSNVKTKGNHACLIWRSTFYSGHRIAILSTTNPFIIHTKEWEDNKGTWALQRSSLSIFIYNIYLSSCSMSFNVPLSIPVRNDDYLPDSLRCVVEINTFQYFLFSTAAFSIFLDNWGYSLIEKSLPTPLQRLFSERTLPW